MEVESLKNYFGPLLTAMVTPFDEEDGKIDLNRAIQLIKKLKKESSDGVVLSGTTGESPTLTKDEKLSLFEKAARETDGIDIIAGTGSNSTNESIEFTKEAEKTGVNGIMLVVPYYNKPSQQGLYEHFKRIANNTSLPIIVYNVPGRTGIGLSIETTAHLSKIDNIVALKDSTKDIEYALSVCNNVSEEFAVYSGDDAMTLPLISIGGYGVISVASHLVGDKLKEIIKGFNHGNREEAITNFRRLYPLFKAMFLETNPVPVKEALNMINVKVGKPRLPLIEMHDDNKNKLFQILSEYKLIN